VGQLPRNGKLWTWGRALAGLRWGKERARRGAGPTVGSATIRLYHTPVFDRLPQCRLALPPVNHDIALSPWLTPGFKMLVR
jgi:hypothetical protein